MTGIDRSRHRPILGPVNVSLTRDLEDFVRRKVESGLYTSASEVVREALRLLAEQDALARAREEELRRRVDEGRASARKGRTRDGEDVLARLEARLRKLEDDRERG